MGVLFVASLFVTRLNREWHVDALLERAGKGGPIVAGAAFAIAWTPCIGPTLGAILSAASLSDSAARGAFLLAVYSAGLAIPFLLTAVAFSRMTTAFAVVKRHYQAIVATGGVILIAMGILIWTGQLTQLNIEAQSWLTGVGLDFWNSGLKVGLIPGSPVMQTACDDRRDGLELLADGLDLLEALAVEVPRADDPEPPRPDLRIGHHRQPPNLVPAQPLDLERVHPHLGRRKRAIRVVLVDRLRDRLEILRLRGSHDRKVRASASSRRSRPSRAASCARFEPGRWRGIRSRPVRGSCRRASPPIRASRTTTSSATTAIATIATLGSETLTSIFIAASLPGRSRIGQPAREEDRAGPVVTQEEEKGAVGVERDRIARGSRSRRYDNPDDCRRGSDGPLLVDGEVGGVLDEGDFQRHCRRDAGEVRALR